MWKKSVNKVGIKKRNKFSFIKSFVIDALKYIDNWNNQRLYPKARIFSTTLWYVGHLFNDYYFGPIFGCTFNS